jgi:hypothetical protein
MAKTRGVRQALPDARPCKEENMALEFGPLQPEDAAACAEIGGDVFAGINIPYFLERKYGLSGYGGRMNAYWTRSLLQSDPRHFLVARDGA